MAIPPPPPPGPPGPPPPPIGGLKLGTAGKSSGGDPRSALLQSIQKGTKLKKVTTVDKSAPAIAGKVANGNASVNSAGPPSRPPPPSIGVGGNAHTNGMPKLGGIFGGMSAMPKLKPVGDRSISSRTSPPNESPASSMSQSNPTSNTASNSNGVTSDFNAELTKHLTLKKQKKEQQQQGTNASESNARANRGPPPQPPNKITSNAIDSNSIRSTSNNLLKQQQQQPQQNNVSSVTANGTIVPNKSSLFGKNAVQTALSTTDTTSNISSKNNLNNSFSSTGSCGNTTNNTSGTSKTIPNYGKPNCAPKPPGIQQIIAAKNNGNTTSMNNNGRPVVSRHHSMRSPRSPPISVAGGPVFPATQHFGTMRGAPPSFQSQDAISIRQAPNPPISRPTVAPPRPPNIKPPPPPIRSISNTNLTTLPLSVPPSTNANNFGSTSNVSSLKDQYSLKNHGGNASSVNNVSTLVNNITNASSTLALNSSSPISSNNGSSSNLSLAKERSPNGNNNAPPLPPHRTCPAPPPPIRQTSITPNQGAPPVPQRNSSMRNSNPNATITSIQATQSQQITSSGRTITRFIIDLDAKFGHTFHNVTEFPLPSPFTNFQKSYPSRNVKTTTETRKAKAPSPPVKTNDTTETNDKYYLQLNDDKIGATDSSYC